MLTLKDLSEYDIKNVDVGKLIKDLMNRKDILVNIAVILVTLFLFKKVVGVQNKTIIQLKSQTANIKEKMDALADYEAIKKQADNYIDKLPQGIGRVDNIVEKVNELAVSRGIKILSFTPSGKNKDDFYEITRVKLSIEAPRYEDAAYFVSDIEKSDLNLRVENWSISLGQRRRRGRRSIQSGEETIGFSMEIASIKFTE